MPEKKLTGRIAAERIRMQSTPKPPAGAVARYLALGECTSLISDVMDELGVPEGIIGASVLKPTLPGKLVVGPALTVRNLSVFFGENHVLKGVSLNIAAKAVTAIIGPSGCGKSTFLRALNRLHELVPEARMTVISWLRASNPMPSSDPTSAPAGKASSANCGIDSAE